jgi:hypothetical protein
MDGTMHCDCEKDIGTIIVEHDSDCLVGAVLAVAGAIRRNGNATAITDASILIGNELVGVQKMLAELT